LNFDSLSHAINLEIIPAIGLQNLHEGVLGLESLVFIADLPPFGPAEQFKNPIFFETFTSSTDFTSSDNVHDVHDFILNRFDFHQRGHPDDFEVVSFMFRPNLDDGVQAAFGSQPVLRLLPFGSICQFKNAAFFKAFAGTVD
jgi:hypothetical protein